MERGAFYEALAPGPNRLKGFVIQLSGAPGDAAGPHPRERRLQGRVLRPLPAGDRRPDEAVRRLDRPRRSARSCSNEVQTTLLDQYFIIPILRQALINASVRASPTRPRTSRASIPQYVYIGPYEDIALKD